MRARLILDVESESADNETELLFCFTSFILFMLADLCGGRGAVSALIITLIVTQSDYTHPHLSLTQRRQAAI